MPHSRQSNQSCWSALFTMCFPLCSSFFLCGGILLRPKAMSTGSGWVRHVLLFSNFPLPAIDIAAYAGWVITLMLVVLWIKELQESWSTERVSLERGMDLYKGTLLNAEIRWPWRINESEQFELKWHRWYFIRRVYYDISWLCVSLNE